MMTSIPAVNWLESLESLNGRVPCFIVDEIQIGDRSEILGRLRRNREVIEITVMVIVVRCFRADVRGNERRQLPIQQIESNAAMKRGTVVVVFDTRVNALRN